ncbi:hypothetical protein [Sphingomonas sp. 3P27F8]|uniref:hypothetical protein n=1 Tax=Sphingomonas sp. 3P27F8 TaxID=2502213 RepID=UPI0010F7A663|nr:hypothetical protein [Sphingomonas sp. 3P27F8]
MNDRAAIFQRNTTPLWAREAEETRLCLYAKGLNLKVVSTYVASGQPNLLTIEMLVGHCITREQAGHLVLSSLDLLWVGAGLQDVLERLEKADTIVHVVPSETT